MLRIEDLIQDVQGAPREEHCAHHPSPPPLSRWHPLRIDRAWSADTNPAPQYPLEPPRIWFISRVALSTVSQETGEVQRASVPYLRNWTDQVSATAPSVDPQAGLAHRFLRAFSPSCLSLAVFLWMYTRSGDGRLSAQQPPLLSHSPRHRTCAVMTEARCWLRRGGACNQVVVEVWCWCERGGG